MFLPPAWEYCHASQKAQLLEDQTLIQAGVLLENEELVAMLKGDKSEADCLNFIRENF